MWPDTPYQTSYRYINLFMDNSTDQDVKLVVPWNEAENGPHCLVNDQRLEYIHAPVAPAGTKVMDSIWYTAQDGEPLESMDMLLQITDSHGRHDQIQVHIDALSEAQTEGGYRILDAEQLRMTAAPMN